MEPPFKMDAGRCFRIPTIASFVLYFLSNIYSCHGMSGEHQRYKRDEGTVNMTGLWISNGVMLAFVSCIVLFGIYKSYIGKIDMPVRREEQTDQTADSAPKKREELSAVNPTFLDDGSQAVAATQTDFPEEGTTEKV